MSIICPNSIFISIPKTGGTFIHNVIYKHYWYDEKTNINRVESSDPNYVLQPGGTVCATPHQNKRNRSKGQSVIEGMWKDLPVQRSVLLKLNPALEEKYPDWAELVKHLSVFTFVRHPLSWYASYWTFRNRTIQTEKSNRWEFSGGIDYPLGKLDSQCESDKFETFVKNVVRNKGYLKHLYWCVTKDCRYVGRQENLKNDLIYIWKALNEDFDEKIIKDMRRVNKSEEHPVYSQMMRDDICEVEEDVINLYYTGSNNIPIIRNYNDTPIQSRPISNYLHGIQK